MSTETPLRVVIADDDALARCVIKHALEAMGMTVLAEAEDGRAAVELALTYRPDVVVLDAVMPGLDGILATRRILSAGLGLLVVVLTSAGEEELGLQALYAGATAVASKDADLDELARAVEGAGRLEIAISRVAG